MSRPKMMPLDLLRAKIGFKNTDLKAPFLRKITLRQGTSRSCEHQKCRLKASGERGTSFLQKSRLNINLNLEFEESNGSISVKRFIFKIELN